MVKILTRPVEYAQLGDAADPRFCSIISTDPQSWNSADILLLGVPTDEGIRRNGGRLGAAEAPAAIRGKLGKLTVAAGLNNLRIADLGDAVADSLEEQHAIARLMAAWCAKEGKLLISLGGGHDVTYPLVAGFAESRELSLINIDAHADVRERKEGLHHSGSSFRLLIDEGLVAGDRFTEFGLQRFAVASSHVDWLRSKGASVLWLDEIKNCEQAFNGWLDDASGPCYVSFDLDSIRASDAPSSSAPSPIGFTSDDALRIAYLAGRHPQTVGFDIVEVSPPHDRDGQTAKLAALMVAEVVRGFSQRSAEL